MDHAVGRHAGCSHCRVRYYYNSKLSIDLLRRMAAVQALHSWCHAKKRAGNFIQGAKKV